MGMVNRPPPREKRMEKQQVPGRVRLDKAMVARLRAWKLEEAKARFSEVVRRARADGPQSVTYRGQDAVVVIAVEEFRKLLPAERPRQALVEFLRGTPLGEIDVHREPDRGRDLPL